MRLLAAILLVLAAPRLLSAQERGAVALGEGVAGLDVTARVLLIGAHPDDEDTQLLTWLARGQQVETAYLSLTRGDGGQNLIGNELGEALGVIRTEELLAARRLDGAHQYFTRAYDSPRSGSNLPAL
jgi:LmbE family N-acetylglucosaminyl deacetylase